MVDLPYCKPERDRHGRIAYWYFRRNGRRWRLPGEPLSAEWLAEYARLKAETDAEPKAQKAEDIKPRRGSFRAVVMAYMRSPEWRNLKPSSQRAYRQYLDHLVMNHGHLPIALIERHHIKKWRAAKESTPGVANQMVKTLRILLAYAVDSGERPDNPALHIKPFKLGEHRAWTEAELAAFEQRWPPGTMQRRAYALARYTGQRCGDVAAMTLAHRRNGGIWVKQQKTGQELWVAEHRELTAELARGDQGNMSLITKANGQAFDADGLSQWFAKAIAAAGLPKECVTHGLRKVAARDLAEAGCSVHEIMSVTGHASLNEVQRYTKSANQRKLADAAILKLERNSKGTESGKRPAHQRGKR